jgi:RNA polymerase sigma-32 factor
VVQLDHARTLADSRSRGDPLPTARLQTTHPGAYLLGVVQPIEDTEGLTVVEADELLASDEGEPELPLDDEGPVLDMGGGQSLVKRGSVSLADEAGEWIKEAEAKAPPPPKAEREYDQRLRDAYQSFVRQATRLERLTEEQERALGYKVRDHGDQDAAKKLVVHNLRLVIKMAHQYRRSWTNIMDLVQEGSAGMAIASQRWDPDQGTKFGTYAVYWIRAQLTKFLMTNGRVIHTGNTRAGRKLYFQLPRIRRQLIADGKEPTIDAIAKVVGEDRSEVEKIVSRLDGREASLSAPVGDEDSGTLSDLIADEGQVPDELAANLEMQDLMKGLTERFRQTITDERDLAVWNEHLVSEDPTSLVELGKRYGVSKQRMGQLATRLKRGFRRHVIDELGPHTELSWLFDRE